MSESITTNPYAVTTEALVGPDYGNDVETMRKKYLSHEASVKSIGSLYILGAAFIGLLAVGYIVTGVRMFGQADQAAAAIIVLTGFVMAGFAGLYGFVAKGLWQLRPWARIVATVLSALGLLGFPIGTLISAYFLYLLQSPKAATVFSEQYKEVIKATPHIKYKTSIFAWILLGLCLALIAAVIIAVIGNR